MPHRPRRSNLILLLLAWLTLLAVAGFLLITSELRRLEQQFRQTTGALAADIRHTLYANEAVLSGLSAFLLAVERDDYAATERYAATVAAAYPHIYQIEIARRVATAEAAALAENLRRNWRADFRLKSFSALTGREPVSAISAVDTWPILFMHPALPDTLPIFGLQLETVDHLAGTLARALGQPHAVASPVFELYEGETGYLLLQTVERPHAGPEGRAADFFGDTMAAMLLIKSAALLPTMPAEVRGARIGIRTTLVGNDGIEGPLVDQPMESGSRLDRWLLPVFMHAEHVQGTAQKVLVRFTQQQRLRDVFAAETAAVLLLLLAAALATPWLMLRHYRALMRAGIEHEQSAYLATHDVLTGLPNRYLLADRFDAALHAWQRHGTRFAVILLDLDHFKDINDRFGHEAGDRVLCVTGERMTAQLRASDTVARYGGDEFVILLGSILDAEDALRVGEKLLAAVSQPVQTSAGALPLACSLGIAICPDHGTDLDSLRRRADIAMYAAKQSGRRAVVLAPVSTA